MQIALSKSGDIIKGENGGIVRVTDGRYVLQSVQSRLKTNRSEWLLQPDIGWISLQDFGTRPNLYDIEVRAREIILGTEDVLTIGSINLEFTKRTLFLSFTATTTFGGIDTTVPWEI